MEKIVKALSHEDRILGRIVSGGSQVSSQNEMGKMLIYEISKGFFERKRVNNTLMACRLHLPFTVFHTFRNTSAN